MGRIRVYVPRKIRIIRLEHAAKARIAAGDSRFWVSGESFLPGLEADSRSYPTSSCQRIITSKSQFINIGFDENIET